MVVTGWKIRIQIDIRWVAKGSERKTRLQLGRVPPRIWIMIFSVFDPSSTFSSQGDCL